MAATSIMNSTDVVIQISEDGGTTYDIIGRATSASLSVSMETRDITSKDSAGWQENLEGLKSWSLSGDGLVTYSISGDYDLLMKLYVPDGDDIGLFMNDNVLTIDGIERTHTTQTFKAF